MMSRRAISGRRVPAAGVRSGAARGLIPGGLLALAVHFGAARPAPAVSVPPAVSVASAAPASPAATRVGADAIRLPSPVARPAAAALLEGDPGWTGIRVSPIHLNRTPPLYEGDPLDDGWRPAAEVALARTPDALVIRLRWSDSTESRPAVAVRRPDAGDSTIYKAHSLDIERFADAACVMVPRHLDGRSPYPGLMMGDAGAPVDLYYWHLVHGFEKLEAAGRATTRRTGGSFPGSIRRTPHGWEAVFQLPSLPPATPIAFAVWDGGRGQRDGLKYYSVWCEVGP